MSEQPEQALPGTAVNQSEQSDAQESAALSGNEAFTGGQHEESLPDLLIVESATAEAQGSQQSNRSALKAVIEAAIYITDEPLTVEQIASGVEQPVGEVQSILSELIAEYAAPERGLSIRELAGGFKMGTKAEHHDSVRLFVKKLQPPLKLSLAALESLAVIAYKQPITAPEIMDIRGVQGTSVLKTLLDRKLIATAGRKNVLGKPIMYRTTRDFLVQFGLSSLAELPTLKEFEELGRLAFSDSEELTQTGLPSEQPGTEEASLHSQPPSNGTGSVAKHDKEAQHLKIDEVTELQDEPQEVNG